MSNSEIIKAARAVFDAGDLQRYADFLAEDFQWVGSFPKPLNKKSTLVLLTALKTGIPDLSLNFCFVAEMSENTVRGTIAPSGTHTAPLVLPGVAPLSPTGKSFAATRQLIEYTFVNGKISRFEIGESEGGELFKMLEYLGLELGNVSFAEMFPD
jgi:hypothetical protein